MNENIFIVNATEYGADREFWETDNLMQETFSTYDEYYEFWNSLASFYPEGIPEEYIWQKLEQYRYFRMLEALDELEQMNLVIKSQNEDGEDVWRINPNASRAA